MELLDKPRRFIPCPICHGKGGHSEPVPGLWESGPYYPATCCDDERTLDAYLRVKAANEALWAKLEAAICACGHDAGAHYGDSFAGCGWTSDEPDGSGQLTVCHCERTRAEVLGE